MNSRLFLLPVLLASLMFTASAGARPVKKLWSIRHPATDALFSSAADGAGNVVIAGFRLDGYAHGFPLGHTYVAMYAAGDGTLLWEKEGPAKTSYNEYSGFNCSSVTFDHAGNVIVSYSYPRSPNGYATTYSTEKYTTTGRSRWRKQYLSSSGFIGRVHVAVDAEDNAIVSGRYDPEIHREVTNAYAGADGHVLWEIPNDGDGSSSQLALDSAGNILASGCHDAGDGFHSHPFAAKFSGRDGKQLWEHRPLDAFPLALTTNRAGNIAITGFTEDFECVGDEDGTSCYGFPVSYYTFKLAADGEILWKKLYFPPLTEVESAGTGVALDSAGNVIVTGYTGKDCYSAKYASKDGKTLWEKRVKSINSLPASYDTPAAAVDDTDNVVLGCTHRRANGRGEILTAKYAPNGTALWKALYAESIRQNTSSSLAVGPGFVLVSGFNGRTYGFARDLIIKYVDGATPETLAADGISAIGATLHGSVNPNGFAATAFFEYGTDPALVGAIALTPVTIGKNATALPVDAALSSLNPVTTYYYRVAATANGNTTRGVIRQFTTPPRMDIVHPPQAKAP